MFRLPCLRMCIRMKPLFIRYRRLNTHMLPTTSHRTSLSLGSFQVWFLPPGLSYLDSCVSCHFQQPFSDDVHSGLEFHHAWHMPSHPVLFLSLSASVHMRSSSSTTGSTSGLDKSFCMAAFLPSSLSSLENMLSAASPDAALKTNILINVVHVNVDIFLVMKGYKCSVPLVTVLGYISSWDIFIHLPLLSLTGAKWYTSPEF